MAGGILTDLVSPVSYTGGEELAFKITVTAPADGVYYVLGALYDSNYNFISGSLFGVLLPAGAAYAFNSSAQVSLHTLSEGDIEEIDCRFIFTRTSMVVGLYLMELVGSEPCLGDDTEIASVTAILAGEETAGLNLNSLVSLMVIAGMAGIMMKVIK